MLRRNLTKSLELQGYSGFNKMVADKLSYFRINGKLSASLALLHGLATGWYFLTPNKELFREHHGLHHEHRGLMRSIKSNLVTTCPIECSINSAILITAGFILEQQLGTLFIAKSVALLAFSSMAVEHIRITGEKGYKDPAAKQMYRLYGMHNISFGLLLMSIIKNFPDRKRGFLLAGLVLALDIFGRKGFESFGYLPALYLGILI